MTALPPRKLSPLVWAVTVFFGVPAAALALVVIAALLIVLGVALAVAVIGLAVAVLGFWAVAPFAVFHALKAHRKIYGVMAVSPAGENDCPVSAQV